MSKINLLVISPKDLGALRNLVQLRDCAEISISNDAAELAKLAAAAEVILLTGLPRTSMNLQTLWKLAKSVRWVHSLSAGVENTLFPALVESTVPLTNARGVFKRPLAEFAMLGILFHFKKVRRLIDNQNRHKWDDFSVKLADRRVMGIVGFGEIDFVGFIRG